MRVSIWSAGLLALPLARLAARNGERLCSRWHQIDKNLDSYAARRPGGAAVGSWNQNIKEEPNEESRHLRGLSRLYRRNRPKNRKRATGLWGRSGLPAHERSL